MRETLVSTRTLRDGLKEFEEGEAAMHTRFLPPHEQKLVEWTLLEFRRLIKAAEVEYVSTGTAAELTGWDAQTLRKYARLALAGDPVPEDWENLVVRREGKEYAIVLATIPPKAGRASAA